ncbi:MAG: class I SAM-dependent methyltransferase [Planctomycetota bacterium]
MPMLDRIPETEVMDDADEAHAYDAMDHTQSNMAFVERLLELGIDQCNKALDLGTGPGDIPIMLCGPTQAVAIFAVDLAQSMLDLAKRKIEIAGLGDRITLANMDVKALDLPDASFDAVFSNTILHHIPEPAAMLAEAARVLKPGGLLLIRDLYRPESMDQLNVLVDQHAGDCDAEQRRLFADSLHAALTPDELRVLADANGLSDCEIVIDTDRHLSLQRKAKAYGPR